MALLASSLTHPHVVTSTAAVGTCHFTRIERTHDSIVGDSRYAALRVLSSLSSPTTSTDRASSSLSSEEEGRGS